ncbi:MAG: DUF5686 family protein [Bacteroidota bacterium]|nr:DUF5686 family protein [Bacteroidota bacterium]
MKFIFMLFPALLFSQTYKIHGTILDDSTRQTLSFATIRVQQTDIVTSANKEGAFVLDLPLGQHMLQVSYVGYNSRVVEVTVPDSTAITIELRSAIIQLPEVSVGANSEDPAMEIMREVIKRRDKNYEGLNNYEVTGYKKNILYSGDRITMIEEQFVRQIYEAKGLDKSFTLSTHKSENVKKSNMQISMNIGASLFFVSGKFSLGVKSNSQSSSGRKIFPLSDDAFQYYDYKLLNTKIAGKEITYTIQVIPKSSVEPLLKGKILIDDATYAVVGADVETNEAWNFPLVKNFSLKILQSYADYNGFWIPQYSEVEFAGEISAFGGMISFDKMKISEVFSTSSCKVNGTIPDSVRNARRSKYGGYTTDTVKAVAKLKRYSKTKRAPAPEDQQFEPSIPPQEIQSVVMDTLRPLVLTAREKIAFAELDSTQTMEKLMKPKGALASLNSVSDSGSALKTVLFALNHILTQNNRVEGVTPGLWSNVDEMDSPIFYNGEIAYATGAKKIEWKIGGGYNLGDDHLDRLDVNVWNTIQPWQPSRFISKTVNSMLFSITGDDYYHYMHSSGFNIGVHKYFTDSLFMKLYFSSEDEKSIQKNSNVALIKKNQPINHSIKEGKNNVLRFQFGFEPVSPIPFLIHSDTRIVFDAEFSLSSLQSDFEYDRYFISAETRMKTMYSTMFNPPYVLLLVEGGYINGTYGIQHLLTPSSALSLYAPVGVLKGMKYYDLVGDKFIALQAEHNWQTLPFTFIGMKKIEETGLQIITGGSIANVWNTTSYYAIQDKWKPYWEGYIGVGNIFDLFRVDVVHTSNNLNVIRASISSTLFN